MRDKRWGTHRPAQGRSFRQRDNGFATAAFLLLAVMATSGCSSVPGVNRMMVAENITPVRGHIVVGDVVAQLGRLTRYQGVVIDKTMSNAASERLRTALGQTLADEGFTVEVIDWNDTKLSDRSVGVMHCLYENLMYEGFADKKDPIIVSAADVIADLQGDIEGDYLLLTKAYGIYQSVGRVASNVVGVMAAATVGVGFVQTKGGGEYTIAGLYDLKTGDLVWVNKISIKGADLDDPDDAMEVAGLILKGLPTRDALLKP